MMNFADVVMAHINYDLGNTPRFIQMFAVGDKITYTGSVKELNGLKGIVTAADEVFISSGNFDWRYKVVLVSGDRLSRVRDTSLTK
jgi:acyl dehydratase